MRIHNLCCVAMVLLLNIATTASAQNLGFLRNAPISYFSDEDTKLMMRAAEEALSDERENASREWSNAKSGNSGKSEVLRVFTGQTGQTCKRLRVSNKARNGIEGQSTYPICKKDGTWMIASGVEQSTGISK